MLEIFALITLTRKIGYLAEEKGLKPGTWKLYVVLFWFLAEIVGVIIGNLLFQNTIPAVILGYTMAISSYFTLRAILSKKRDTLMEEEINQIGQPVAE